MMNEKKILIAPSLLACDFTRLGEEVESVLAAGVDWLHVDVMDGHYVPNLTIGLPIVEWLRKRFPEVFLDVHLMISNPDDFLEQYIEAGADQISFHAEVSKQPHRAVQRIKAAGARASLAVNPGSSLSTIDYMVEMLDNVLIMSVNPGFGGQKFIDSTLRKLRELTVLLEDRGLTPDVQVDGGVSAANIAAIRDAGANVFVAGSALFGTTCYVDTVRLMREALG